MSPLWTNTVTVSLLELGLYFSFDKIIIYSAENSKTFFEQYLQRNITRNIFFLQKITQNDQQNIPRNNFFLQKIPKNGRQNSFFEITVELNLNFKVLSVLKFRDEKYSFNFQVLKR